jgi:hypothetical protein
MTLSNKPLADMRLPKPNDFGSYLLADGSVIHRSSLDRELNHKRNLPSKEEDAFAERYYVLYAEVPNVAESRQLLWASADFLHFWTALDALQTVNDLRGGRALKDVLTARKELGSV